MAKNSGKIYGVPPGKQKSTGTQAFELVCETELSEREINLSLASGSLKWAETRNGVRWFRRMAVRRTADDGSIRAANIAASADPSARLVAALLPETHAYVVLQSDGPPLEMPHAIGVTHRSLDVHLENWLRGRGQWFGRGPAIYLGDETIHQFADEATGGDDELFAKYSDELLAAVACHEAGHVVESGIDKSQPTPAHRQFVAGVMKFSNDVPDSEMRDFGWPPFLGHNAQFVRAAVHLAHRAAKLGRAFPIDLLFNDEVLGIAPATQFATTLGNEPADLERESIFSISEFRPPRAFVLLWQSCVNHWIELQPSDSPHLLKARDLLLEVKGT